MPADILHWIATVVRQRFQRFTLLRNDSGGVACVFCKKHRRDKGRLVVQSCKDLVGLLDVRDNPTTVGDMFF